ncbi:uncharacterized protein LOC126735659 [Anthonomus grandis grandis]|uniref:uncharacterized protein LOC126735659 n=1 Tax=Anthonomus grandis grandis TaxID=2921223 RepID=UPI002166C117|nr:uncharacterized protein LOC126735659 [Anthonomus grandis grandis]
MGDHPQDRVTPSPPFYATGVDYAGPINLKTKKGRGAKIIKSYICVFICLSTRAIHLEIVSELTTSAFIATFRRFVSRRGKPSIVRSDNGSNFVGAKSELKELGNLLQNQASYLKEVFENNGIRWQFIPPRSPNFGGIWKAGVKSCKYHLKRIMGNASLTFEDLYTLITQNEATLNSRPLVPIFSDPSDFDLLTPGHFLIGRRLTALPDPSLLDLNENRLSKFQHLQRLYQQFWARWSKEYVVLLQQRWKWKNPEKNLEVGELVLVRDDNLPPLNWKLGRVLTLHPGLDGKCRVVSLKTNKGVIKRAITKLCALPLSDN